MFKTWTRRYSMKYFPLSPKSCLQLWEYWENQKLTVNWSIFTQGVLLSFLLQGHIVLVCTQTLKTSTFHSVNQSVKTWQTSGKNHIGKQGLVWWSEMSHILREMQFKWHVSQLMACWHFHPSIRILKILKKCCWSYEKNWTSVALSEKTGECYKNNIAYMILTLNTSF